MAITLTGFGFNLGNVAPNDFSGSVPCSDAGADDNDYSENGYDACDFSSECDNGDEEGDSDYASALAATWGEPSPMPTLPAMPNGSSKGKGFLETSHSIHQYALSVHKQSFDHHLDVEKKHLDARGDVDAAWAKAFAS